MGDGVKAKKSRIHEHFFNKMTVEEIAEWRAKAQAKGKASHAKRKEERLAQIQKAKELVPHLLAVDMVSMEDDKYIPPNDVLERVRRLLEKPEVTLETLRRDHFRNMSERGWQKLTSFLFKDHISNESDLGLQILETRKKRLGELGKIVKGIEKEIRLHKKAKRKEGKTATVPFGLLELRITAQKNLMDYEAEVNRTLFKQNLDTKNNKASTAIHIHTQIPRPSKEEAKDITPPKVQSLAELVDGN